MLWTPDLLRARKLTYWWDARAPRTITTDSTNRVSSWRDRIQGFALTPEVTYGPLRLSNGELSFAYGYTLRTASSVSLTSKNTIFVLAGATRNPPNINESPRIMTYTNPVEDYTYNTGIFFMQDAGSPYNIAGYFGAMAGVAPWPGGKTTDGRNRVAHMVLSHRFGDSTSTMRVNGRQGATVAASPALVGSAVIKVGGGPGTDDWWTGTINEVLVFDAQLTTREIQLVEGYLAHKWHARLERHPFAQRAPMRLPARVLAAAPLLSYTAGTLTVIARRVPLLHAPLRINPRILTSR